VTKNVARTPSPFKYLEISSPRALGPSSKVRAKVFGASDVPRYGVVVRAA
jgi:hypothetical protein